MAATKPKSKVAMCNLSLSLVKQKPISSIDKPLSDNENLCAMWFDEVRLALLRETAWNFAIRRVALAPDATAPIFGFTHRFKLPSDFVRFLTRHDSEGLNLRGFSRSDDFFLEGYQLEDGFLLTNADTSSGSTVLNLRYIYDHIVVAAWDSHFVDLFAHQLGIKLAPNFKGSEARIRELKQEIRDIRARATAVDSQERPPIRIQRSKFLRARRGRPNEAGPRVFFS